MVSGVTGLVNKDLASVRAFGGEDCRVAPELANQSAALDGVEAVAAATRERMARELAARQQERAEVDALRAYLLSEAQKDLRFNQEAVMEWAKARGFDKAGVSDEVDDGGSAAEPCVGFADEALSCVIEALRAGWYSRSDVLRLRAAVEDAGKAAPDPVPVLTGAATPAAPSVPASSASTSWYGAPAQQRVGLPVR